MEPNFAELAHQGRMLMVAQREADTAAGLPHPSSLEARLASAMQVTPTRAARQSQSEIDAGWATVIAEAGHGRHAPRPTPQMDSNHGWDGIIAQVEREQTQTNFAASASGQQSENHGWGDVFKRAANGA